MSEQEAYAQGFQDGKEVQYNQYIECVRSLKHWQTQYEELMLHFEAALISNEALVQSVQDLQDLVNQYQYAQSQGKKRENQALLAFSKQAKSV